MELIKKTDDYVIYQKRSKRYAVKSVAENWINGDEKIKILLKEKLVKVAAPKPKEEPKVEEAPAKEAATEKTPAETS